MPIGQFGLAAAVKTMLDRNAAFRFIKRTKQGAVGIPTSFEVYEEPDGRLYLAMWQVRLIRPPRVDTDKCIDFEIQREAWEDQRLELLKEIEQLKAEIRILKD